MRTRAHALRYYGSKSSSTLTLLAAVQFPAPTNHYIGKVTTNVCLSVSVAISKVLRRTQIIYVARTLSNGVDGACCCCCSMAMPSVPETPDTPALPLPAPDTVFPKAFSNWLLSRSVRAKCASNHANSPCLPKKLQITGQMYSLCLLSQQTEALLVVHPTELHHPIRRTQAPVRRRLSLLLLLLSTITGEKR